MTKIFNPMEQLAKDTAQADKQKADNGFVKDKHIVASILAGVLFQRNVTPLPEETAQLVRLYKEVHRML